MSKNSVSPSFACITGAPWPRGSHCSKIPTWMLLQWAWLLLDTTLTLVPWPCQCFNQVFYTNVRMHDSPGLECMPLSSTTLQVFSDRDLLLTTLEIARYNTGGWWHLNWRGLARGNGWSGIGGMVPNTLNTCLMPFHLLHFSHYYKLSAASTDQY